MNRFVALVAALASVCACNGEIYLRDGVTDGDTFSISPYAMGNQDPVVQSWIRYSLARSVCQLDAGTENPARANSLRCETTSRRHLAEAWIEHTAADPALEDAYLDDLRFVFRSGWLDEYVARHFGNSQWDTPPDLDMSGYRRWEKRELAGHRPVTRIIGSWSYRRNRSAY